MKQNSVTILAVGVGNELRGDDAAGLHVVRKLRNLNLPGVRVIESSGAGVELMDAWTGLHSVFVFDATIPAGHAGAIRLFEEHSQPFPANLFGISTHSFGLAEAIELSRHLGRMPRELIVYGIEGKTFDIGQAVSPAVTVSIQTVFDIVTAEIKEHRMAHAHKSANDKDAIQVVDFYHAMEHAGLPRANDPR